MNFRDKLEPAYDPRPFDQIPKVRGVVVSMLISLVVWVTTSAMLASALYVAGNAWIYICDGHFPHGNHSAHISAVLALLAFSMIIELLARQTPHITFLCCRTWPSLAKSILFSMVGRRYGSGTGYTRVNRIGIMGY